MKSMYRNIIIPVILIVFLFIFFSVYQEIKNKTIAQFNTEQLLIAKSASQGIQDYFGNLQSDLKFLTLFPELIDLKEKGKELVGNFYKNRSEHIEAITITDSNGIIKYTYPENKDAVGMDISYQQHFAKVMKEQKPVISDVFRAVQGYLAIAIHVPVFKNGEFNGSLAILISIDKIGQRYLGDIKKSESGYAMLLSENNIEIYTPFKDNISKSILDVSQNDAMVLQLLDSIQTNNSGTINCFHDSAENSKKTEKNINFYRIPLENTYWTILISIPQTEITKTISSFRNRLVILFLVILLTLFVYFFFFIKARKVLREEKKRKNAEKALIESEERLRLSTELANVGVWEIDFRTNIMTRSRNHDLLYGLEYRKKWEFENYQKCTHPDDWAYFNEMIHLATAPGGSDKYKFDFRVVYPNQTIHWLNITGVVIERNKKGEAVIVRGTLIDITDRKQVEDTIKQKNIDLTTLLGISQTLTSTLNTKIVLQNIVDKATNLIGLDTGAIYLINEQNLYLGATIPPIPSDLPDVFRHALLKEHPHIKKAISTGLPVMLPDLQKVELSPAETAIKESRAMRSLLYIPLSIENRANGVLILGTQKETREFSEAEINLYRTISGQAALAIYNSQLFEDIKELNKKLENRVAERTHELSNSQAALLNLVEDLNEKSIQLEQSSKKLEAKNKELETFTYSVSHDLKAPLRGIDGYSRLLEENYADNLKDEGRKFVKTIREGTSQMNQLIEDLLTYSRLERIAIQFSKINIKEIISTVLSFLKSEIEIKNISIGVDVDDCEVNTDYNALSIAVRNLIENAIKFSTKTDSPQIQISIKESVSSLILCIADNGIGFDMKYHSRIFEIFQRLNLPEQYKGTGIGLALVNKSMERIGGKVWAESSLGNGAKFYLEIPKK